MTVRSQAEADKDRLAAMLKPLNSLVILSSRPLLRGGQPIVLGYPARQAAPIRQAAENTNNKAAQRDPMG